MTRDSPPHTAPSPPAPSKQPASAAVPRTVRVHREARLPDETRVARCLRAPELGPRLTVFSGGSALRQFSRAVKRYTHNTVHLITPFDSGGSSARLREAFGMLSIGDLRNRLMALADETARGNPANYRLFSHRFPADGDQATLRAELEAMAGGAHLLVRAIKAPMRQLVQTHLRHFLDHMPDGFDLRVASIGNLLMAGSWVVQDRDIESVLFLFSRLVEARGLVRPVVDADLHLAATLADGSTVIGQHLMTGKSAEPLASPVADLGLVAGLDVPEPVRVAITPYTAELIRDSDLVLFPMGSFYTSVLANLLPAGVGCAVANAGCPKVYVPNMGRDPEQVGMTLGDTVERLLMTLRADSGADTPADRLIDMVLLDADASRYAMPLDTDRVHALGVPVHRVALGQGVASGPRVDPVQLTEILVSLA